MNRRIIGTCVKVKKSTLLKVNTEGLKEKAARSAGINIVAQFFGIAIQTVGVVVLARLLTPRDFGLVTMVVVFSLWFMNFGVNGFPEFIIQKKDITEKEVTCIFWLHLIIATSLAGGFGLFGLYLVKFYEEAALSGIAAVMASTFVLYALATTHIALLKRDMKFKAIAVADLIGVACSVVLAVSAAYVGMGYWAVVIRQATIPVVTVIAAWILCPWRPGHLGSLKTVVPALKYALKVYCNFSIGYVSRSIDKVLVGRYHGSDVLGNYDRAVHLAGLPAESLLVPLHGIAMAALSRLQDDKVRFTAYYTKAVSLIAFVGTMASLCLTVSARDLIPLVLGPEWVEAGYVVMAFSPGIAGMLVYGTHSWLHLSLGTPGRWARWNLVAAAFTTAVFFVAAPYGAIAMAMAYSAKTYALVIPGLWYGGRPIGLSMRAVIGTVWVYFAAGFGVGIAWLYPSVYWPPLRDMLISFSPAARIAFTMSLVGFCYVTLVIAFERSLKSFYEMASMIRLMVSR